jgi:hypothetical protein
MFPTKAATTTARTAPIMTTSLNPSGSLGEPLLDGFQLSLCEILGLFIRCTAKTEMSPIDIHEAGGRVA